VEAVATLRIVPVDLVLLDVQMPGLDGFGVLRALGSQPCPAVVFVTAFDEFAIRAFEVHAVDYLLKPFAPGRLRQAVERARERRSRPAEPAADPRLDALLRHLEAPRYDERLVIRDRGRVRVVPLDEVDWLEAADNYVRVHTASGAALLRDTLKALEDRLDPRRFGRAHRSAIVNLARVRHAEPLFNGDYELVLSGGARVTLSRTFSAAFLERLRGGA
jgi:two-component system LytT family response regulator